MPALCLSRPVVEIDDGGAMSATNAIHFKPFVIEHADHNATLEGQKLGDQSQRSLIYIEQSS